jgi:hypothetical protein
MSLGRELAHRRRAAPEPEVLERPRFSVDGRVRVDGKQFAIGDQRFPFHGVTYGTFRGRPSGELFPPVEQVRADFRAMAAAGFTVVRTYTAPSDDMVEAAEEFDLLMMAGFFCPDWHYLVVLFFF